MVDRCRSAIVAPLLVQGCFTAIEVNHRFAELEPRAGKTKIGSVDGMRTDNVVPEFDRCIDVVGLDGEVVKIYCRHLASLFCFLAHEIAPGGVLGTKW